jgi:hypothetical protein
VSYESVHKALRKHRGSASNYDCVECGESARHWAFNNNPENELVDHGGRYSSDLTDYDPMCLRCHRRRDHPLSDHCLEGHPYSGDNLAWRDDGSRLCRACIRAASRRNHQKRLERGHPTPEERARRNEQQRARRRRLREEREAGAA